MQTLTGLCTKDALTVREEEHQFVVLVLGEVLEILAAGAHDLLAVENPLLAATTET
jgi:ribosomal 30S subunit maturation factor RimM